MLQIRIDPGRAFTGAEKQVRHALASALTALAKGAQAGLVETISRVFDRPVALTQRSPRIIPARKGDRPAAVVYIQDEASKGTPPSKYLASEVAGGSRRNKRMERVLQRAGLMPQGTVAVPTRFAPLDTYGNLTGAYVTRMLSILRAFGEQGFKANETDQTEKRRKGRAKRQKKFPTDFFAAGSRDVIRNHGPAAGRGYLPAGVYQRAETRWGSAIRPILLFVKEAKYAPRLPFHPIVEQIVTERSNAAFSSALAEALRTSR